jgi:hypothetical protein
MKYFLASFTLQDGEHEHIEHATASKRSVETATRWCEGELYEYGEERKRQLWHYGDGETAVTDYSLTEITAEEYAVLSKYLFCATPKLEAA